MAIFSLIGYAFAYAGGYLAAAAGISFSTAMTIGTAVGRLAISAAALAINKALTPDVNIPTSEIQAVINQTDASRRVYVGRALAGGIRAFFNSKQSMLYQLVLLAHGPISALREFWIDGVKSEINGVGLVIDGPKKNYVTVLTRDGSDLGGNYAELTASFPSWPVSRRLEKQATFLVKSKAPRGNAFMKVFPKGYSTVFQWVIEGQKVFDPRSGLTVYSDNAALVIAHYLTHEGGYRLDPSEVDWVSVGAMADWCDLPKPQRAGGTAPNMRLWGYWSLDEEPAQVLERMRVSSGIRAYETQAGLIGLVGGPFGVPAMTLTAKDIRSIQTSEAISEREGFNTLRVFFMSEAHNFTMTELDPWVDDGRMTQEGEIATELRPELCPNIAQARHLGKRYLQEHNRAKVEVVTNAVGLKARYPAQPGQRHTILFDYRPEDGSGRVITGEYEVTDHEFDPVNLECRIVLEVADRAVDEWTTIEEGEPPAPLPPEDSNLPPAMVAVLSQRTVQTAVNSKYAALQVEATAVLGWDDLEIEAQYQELSPAGPWRSMPAVDLVATTGALADGKPYAARVRWTGSFEGVAPWVELGPLTIVANPVAPGSPTELFASPGSGYVHISVRSPADDVATMRIYRSTSASFSLAVLVGSTGAISGQISEYRDNSALIGTPYYYWAAAANASGVESAPVGPASITL